MNLQKNWIAVAKVRKSRHNRYNINYHLVWIPKTRMKILVEPFKSTVEETIKSVCAYKQWHPLALQVMPDHVHFFVSAPPKWAPAVIVQTLKAWTSRTLREQFATIRQTRSTDDFWARGFYCGTAGHVSAEQVARYILENKTRATARRRLYLSAYAGKPYAPKRITRRIMSPVEKAGDDRQRILRANRHAGRAKRVFHLHTVLSFPPSIQKLF